jgi:hypothetical protein
VWLGSLIGEAAVAYDGDFVNTRKYQQARRQKEESRKARQQQKLERRLGRATTPDSAPVAEPQVDPSQAIDPAGGSSS